MIKINEKIIEIGNFPDGTLLLKNDSSLLDTSKKQSILWKYEREDELISLIYLTKHLRSCGFKEIHLIMPYIPNARMDRVKNKEDVFTLKYFTEIINSLGFESVTVLDPHSSVSEALIENIRIISPRMYISEAINRVRQEMTGMKELYLYYPDEGAMKRYVGSVRLPYAFGIKDRDWETGEIRDIAVIDNGYNLKNKTILIIDDICSYGGTFSRSAKRLKELGAASIYLYVTHLENSVLNGELLTGRWQEGSLIEKIFTTDNLFTEEHEKVEVFDIV